MGWAISGSATNGGRGATFDTDTGFAVVATATGNGTAIYGTSNGGTGQAGSFSGNVSVSGTLSKAGGSFKIDHPQDPANRYLSHSFVESPDMMNVYNGIAVLDANGEASVEMPSWFEDLNRDFRYQLTPIGAHAPLFIATKIQNGRFGIGGGTAGLEVSWQVTGIRHDAWANAHRIPVESDKPTALKGTYLHPDLFGHPSTKQEDHHLLTAKK